MIKFETVVMERHSAPHSQLKIEYSGQHGYEREPEVHIALTQPDYKGGEQVASGTFPVEELYRIFSTLDRISDV